MSSPNISRDPTGEHQTSAVFQPFPASLLRRLTPSPPQPYLSPIPSSSDVSDPRYSDAPSDLSSASDPDHRFTKWQSRQPDFPNPPPPIHQDRQPSQLSIENNPISRSTPMMQHRPVVSMRTNSPKRRSIQPVGQATPHHHHQRRRLGRAVWRLFTRRRRRSLHAGNSQPTVSLPVVSSVHSASHMGAFSDGILGANSAHGSCTDSLSALRLRVEREVEMEHIGGVDVGGGRVTRGREEPVGGRGIGDGKRNGKGLWWHDSGSVGSMPATFGPVTGRHRVGTFSAHRETGSFGGYRRFMKVGEGSSVSSCEERDEDGEEGHLYLSRRQMRAMQYR